MNTEIKEALIKHLVEINRADTSTLLDAMASVERLYEQHHAELSPQLAHFLERRSYAKALAFLTPASDISVGGAR